MKYKWLNKENNSNIIIFYNGWGMDEGIIKHLQFNNYDVVMFYDYNSLECNFDFSDLKNYAKKYLIAWSMGVMCASLSEINFNKKIAINGTLKPIDNKFGIPEKIYELTLKNFSPIGAKKFIKNMFNEEITNFEIKRDFESQKSELSALKNYKPNLNFIYDKILISDNDKIIPTKNQCNFWNIKPNLKSGHAPFFLFNRWGEIL